MKKYTKFVFFALFVSATSAKAIVDVASLRLDENVHGFSGSALASASGKSGNTEGQNYDAGLGLQWANEQQVNLFATAGNYATVSDEVTDKQYFLHAKHIHKFSKDWGVEAFGQYEAQPLNNDLIKKTVGAGGRYSFSGPSYQGSLGFGSLYEIQTVEILDEEEEASFVRLNLYAKNKYQLSKKSSLGLGINYQPDVDDFSNSISTATLVYTNALSDSLSTTFDLSYQNATDPAPGLEETDTQYKFGLNYRFGVKGK